MNRANRRYLRTVVLGVLAMAALVWSAVTTFDISLQEIAWLFLYTVIVVVIIIAIAALGAALWMGLKHLRRRD